ncbi:kinesin-like protein KIN-12C isoform X1 [Brassica rapa]|uniref:kinesin-like protein KIN-12C isoform X1 n=1 Tax=Brassica campestris TaxID=3711 RepID=UPI00142E8CCA|nr:kinesin-like protein KIN-12C isoform X1 [Brassica rapa]
MPRNAPRIEMPESEENEFASFSLFSPSRAPLNSIPDPSQLQKTTRLSGFDLAQKLELARTQGPERRFEGRAGAHDSNPRIVTRNARSRSEPNSAQSTPTRSGARVSLGGGCVTGARVAQSFVGRGRIPRGISMADCAETAPHFEMNEDHSFWKEHNVQVLIRLRPLSTMERATQGHGRCLKQESPQTLLWLGHPETRFTFDHVASETISQEKLFRVAGLPMVENCLSGYNSCVFAYGQTGSGKTYTMMGEISEAEGSLGEDCGVTARIFEYLFSRIKMEEEGRRDEKLRFSCKCSFLEIYNEQITDLLEPSSTNLQIREDLGKGVYVENLVELNVRTVNDVLKLLLQGAANRKIAATHMNSESSRSHSVFTCTIESIWERDSLTHSRFARLNLVDLAGSERQKSSGAEGDRLKEAANINKSLSTLGLVIMSLVDLAHGKHRHVPYRDSRLTFLLQDSLGGNSKTMIIANVSPSLCSTNETLSTLKFAQRAKLIQNNAKVNEDASGDVTALQQEIRKLKAQLSSLVKSHNSCGALSDCIASLDEPRYSGAYEVARKTQEDKCHCQVNNSLRKKENEVEKEFEDCRKMNSSLVRELDEIQAGLGRYLKFDQIQSDFVASSTSGAEQVNQEHKHSKLETMSTIGENKEEVAFSESKKFSCINGDTDNPDGNRVWRINESQDVLEENGRSMKLQNNKSSMGREVVPRIEGHEFELSGMVNNTDAVMKADEGADRSVMQFKLRKVIKDLEEAKTLNSQYEKEQKILLSQQQDIEVVREQVETETARTILELQEEVIALESEFEGRICKLTEENQSMRDTITARESEIRALNQDWEKATLELTNFIVDGSKSITDASTQIESIVCSFPHVNTWIGDYVEKAAKDCIRKEETILLLQKSLEDARILLAEMDLKLNCLKGATIALNQFQLDGNAAATEESFRVSTELDRMSKEVDTLENDLNATQCSILEAERHAEAAISVKKWLSDSRNQHQVPKKVENQSVKESGPSSSVLASLSAEGSADIKFSMDGYISEATYTKGDELSTSSSDFSNCRLQHDCALNAEGQGVSASESDAQEIHNRTTSAALLVKSGSEDCVYCGEGRQTVQRPLTIMMGRAETERKCSNQRMDPVRSFFDRFEAVNATMKEADLTLCELVKANEKSKFVTGMCLQTHEEQMVKEKNLMDDLEQVKSTLLAKEQESQILLMQTQSTLADMEKSVSLLEAYLLETKREVGETVEALVSDVEQIVSENMEREFTMYATYQCHIGKLMDQILDHRKQVIIPQVAGQENQQSMKTKAIGYSAEDEVTGKLNRVHKAHVVSGFEGEEVVQTHEGLLNENFYLKKELERKEALFEGLLFDFRLLQESASNKRDIKDEMDELFDALCKVQKDLEVKANQVQALFVHNENLENCCIDLKKALLTSKADLEQANESIQVLEEQNDELNVLVRDLCMEKVAAEEGLEEQKELVQRLENEILHLTTTAEKQLVKSIEENLRKTSDEKDQLVEEICSLNDKLKLAYAIADEKEAIAVEARQESEASKIYAEQKEEEVKILEISVEELERTVNILERRVYDMDEEVKRHRTLETELQALRQRLFRFEDLTGTVVTTTEGRDEYESQLSTSKELQGAHGQIQVLQKEVAEQTKEIKQLKEYISEILLHSEAQASNYQEKYKTLEVMIRDFKLEDSNSSAAETAISHKTDKSSTRSRGSSSPFRCIVGLVQQMKLEKDQELTMARVRVEELESLLAAKQKEVCTLNTRIAAADSMTHDVIRDLLGVKMDITSYAELIDQHQIQRVVEEAKQHAEEIMSKDQEIINLKRHIDALVKERESCMSELNKKDTDVLATQISLDQLQERAQLLSLQNEMLKNDKSNLLKKLAELERTVREAGASNQRVPQTKKDTVSFKLADTDYTKRLENAQKLLSHANNELAKYRKTSNNIPSTRTQGQSSGTRYR